MTQTSGAGRAGGVVDARWRWPGGRAASLSRARVTCSTPSVGESLEERRRGAGSAERGDVRTSWRAEDVDVDDALDQHDRRLSRCWPVETSERPYGTCRRCGVCRAGRGSGRPSSARWCGPRA